MDFTQHEPSLAPAENNDLNSNNTYHHLRAAVDDPRLQNVLEQMTKSFKDITDILSHSDIVKDTSSGLSLLYRNFQDLSKFRYPETRTIGLIGATGSGKSSLINSILDDGSLARSKNDGHACTSVVVEYRAVNDQIDRPYTIQVNYMDPEEMRGLLRELLQTVRHYYFRVETATEAVETSDSADEAEDADINSIPYGFEESADVLTPEKVTELKLSSDGALETLYALFRDQAACTPEFLTGNGDPNSETQVLDKLLQMATDGLYRRPGKMTSGCYIQATDGIDECKRYLDLLTTDGRGNDPAIWPFVKLIRVYLDSPILKSGLVLADMPGLRDSDFIRKKVTMKYIRWNCNVLGFVTWIDRCVADPTVEEISARFKPTFPQVVLVTGIDVVNPHEYARNNTESAEHVKRLNDKISALGHEIEALCSAREDAEGAERVLTESRILALQDEKDKLDFERTKFLIEDRNDQVIREMARMRTRKNKKVFCVSNAYFKRFGKGKTKKAKMRAELSGIPQLHQYCSSVPAQAQFDTISSFIRTKVPSELNSLALWTLPAFDDADELKAASIRLLLENAERQLHKRFQLPWGIVITARYNLAQAFTVLILGAIDDIAKEWRDACIEAGKQWRKWRHNTFTAFCRHLGEHSTPSRPNHAWNKELLSPAIKRLEVEWDALMNWMDSEIVELTQGIDEHSQAICRMLETQSIMPTRSCKGLVEAMKLRQKAIEEAFKLTLEKVKDAAEVMKDTMLSDDPLDSYVGDFMYPAYQACNDVEGKGGDRKRKNILTEYTGPKDLVGNYYARAKTEFNRIVGEHFKELQKEVDELVGSLVSDLHNVAAIDGQIPEAARDKEFAGVVSEKVDLTDTLMKEAQALVLELERKEN
ncbi:hypothetical protein PENSUB_8046 [Penicillium subrubescens]|uniref:Nuclear GTPase SLIP-GC n=2 Tax=Penicillium subrubescens TaxID=1316194 RepID=A0A1Q5THX9_9EURO|nr:hypothetical protein PENSUB_8046 [Penicillium subrubescens]